ncbi:hypothetical protein FB451DRAFT_1490718 [Mycena latifolia]|nr:hypothetical protein FB451DRAFT_1490718 [Mycena latifolia]
MPVEAEGCTNQFGRRLPFDSGSGHGLCKSARETKRNKTWEGKREMGKKHSAPKSAGRERGRAGAGEEDGAALTAAALAATNELIATAKELYMSLGGRESGSEGGPANGNARACEGEGGRREKEEGEEGGDDAVEALLGADEAYWRALPRSVREFVGGVYKMQGAPAGGLSSGEFARSVRAVAAALVPASDKASTINSNPMGPPRERK